MIKIIAYNKNPNIGVVGRCNDKVALLPLDCPRDFARSVEETLKVEVIPTNISGTSLLGSLVAMNNNGILLPEHVFEAEKRRLADVDMNAHVVEEKYTALGNLLLLNDNGAIASKVFGKKTLKAMGDILDCEVEWGELAGYKTVGSAGAATNRGALLHPLATEDNLRWIESILKVNVDVGTVNRGVGFIRTGLIANSKGVLVGDETTGPELARIEDALGLL